MNVLCLFAFLSVAVNLVSGEPPVVKVSNGQIAGYTKTLTEGELVYVYEGIRYGELMNLQLT